MKRIGPFRFSGVCSDNTGNTRKGRGLTVTKWPQNLDLLDACHLLSNTGKDICRLPEFKEVSHLYPRNNSCLIWMQPITEMQSILAFLSKSGYTREHLDAQRAKLKIRRGIESNVNYYMAQHCQTQQSKNQHFTTAHTNLSVA